MANSASTHAPSPSTSKLIFAPSSTTDSPQAEQYRKGTLELQQLDKSPFTQFHTWFTSAQSSSVHQPETTCLSTAALPSGSISSRYVYLKELDPRGFVIYSNWGTSRKAKDVESNKQAALAFWWREQERQVRVEGRCERLGREESERYFSVRARGSKVGAWASRQSVVLGEEDGGREVLEGWVRGVEGRFSRPKGKTEAESEKGNGEKDGKVNGKIRGEGDGTRVDLNAEEREELEIPCPDFWGGLRIVPTMVEFWQGRESRLHDRFRYTRVDDGDEGEGEWKIERLSP